MNALHGEDMPSVARINIPSIGESLWARPRWAFALGWIVVAFFAAVTSLTLLGLEPLGAEPDWSSSDAAGVVIAATAFVASVGGALLFGLFWTSALAPVRVSELKSAFPDAQVWKNSMSWEQKMYLQRERPQSEGGAPRLKWNNYVAVSNDEIAFWQTANSVLLKVGSIDRRSAISVTLASIPYMGASAAGLKVTVRASDGRTVTVPLIPSELRMFPRRVFPSEVREILQQWIANGPKLAKEA